MDGVLRLGTELLVAFFTRCANVRCEQNESLSEKKLILSMALPSGYVPLGIPYPLTVP